MIRSVPLRGFDQQMASLVVKEMQENTKVNFLLKCIPHSITKQANGKLQVRWRFVEVSDSIIAKFLFINNK